MSLVWGTQVDVHLVDQVPDRDPRPTIPESRLEPRKRRGQLALGVTLQEPTVFAPRVMLLIQSGQRLPQSLNFSLESANFKAALDQDSPSQARLIRREFAQIPRGRRLTQLAHRLTLDLPNAFATDGHQICDGLERQPLTTLHSKTESQHVSFAG